MDSIDAALEVQQRDKMMMRLEFIEMAIDAVRASADKKFVPLEESAFDGVYSLLNTARLCLDAVGKEFDKWLVADEDIEIPQYEP